MEYISLLAGEPWSDHPACTHPVLAAAARGANDAMAGHERSLLLALAPRMIGTGDGRDDRRVRHELTAELVCWCLRRLPAPPEWDDAFTDAVEVAVALVRATGIADDLARSAGRCVTAIEALAGPLSPADRATRALRRALALPTLTGGDIGTALLATAYFAAQADHDRLGFLRGLLDAHARLTGIGVVRSSRPSVRSSHADDPLMVPA